MHKIDSEGRYFTKTLLIEANDAGIREGRNSLLREEYIENLPDGLFFQFLSL